MKIKIMTLIAHCQKKKVSEYIVAKDVSYTLESCRKREMKVLRTFILKTTKLSSTLSMLESKTVMLQKSVDTLWDN